MEALKKLEKDCIEKFGWYAHFVVDDPMCPDNTNFHTHNLKEAFGHKDLQICLGIRPEMAHSLLTSVIDEIKKGVKFETGKEYDNVFGNGFKAKFIDAFECGRQVLRLIIPDQNGKYEGKYAAQLTKLNNNAFNPALN